LLTLIRGLLLVATGGMVYKRTVAFCASWQPRVSWDLSLEVTDFGLGIGRR